MNAEELRRLHAIQDKREKNNGQTAALTFSERKELEQLETQYEREHAQRWLNNPAN